LSLRNEELQGVESFFAIPVAQPVKNTAAFVETKGSVCLPSSKKFVTEPYHKPVEPSPPSNKLFLTIHAKIAKQSLTLVFRIKCRHSKFPPCVTHVRRIIPPSLRHSGIWLKVQIVKSFSIISSTFLFPSSF